MFGVSGGDLSGGRAWGIAFALIATAALPSRAHAQSTESRALFEKGVTDMEASKFDAACPELEESLRLWRGPGTLFTLAECYSKAGLTASAVSHYETYLDLFSKMTPAEQEKQQGREKTAHDRITTLKPDVPTLTLTLKAGTPAGTEVKRDGVLQGNASLGLALPIDPGAHVITVQPPGGAVSTQNVTVGKGEKKTLELSVGEAGSTTPSTTSSSSTTSTTSSSSSSSQATSEPVDESSRGNGQRIAGVVVGSVGIASLLVGAITGGIALGDKSTVTQHCNIDKGTCRDQTGVDAWHSAQTMGTVSSVTLGIGAAATVGGLIVFLTAPQAKPTHAASISVDVGMTGLSVRGTF
jgi:hypothetical protein